MALLSLKSGYKEGSAEPKSGGRYPVTEKECAPQRRHIDFEVREGGSFEYFIIATCSEQSSFLLRPGSQTCVFSPKEKPSDVVSLLYLKEICVPPTL